MRLPKKYLSLFTKNMHDGLNHQKKTLSIDCDTLIKLMHWLIGKIFVRFGDVCFQQVVGIPMGSDCAPFFSKSILLFIWIWMSWHTN